MAEHEVTLDDEQKLVPATVRGELSKPQGLSLVAEARKLAAQVGYGILWDVRETQLQVDLADFFFLPRELTNSASFRRGVFELLCWFRPTIFASIAFTRMSPPTLG